MIRVTGVAAILCLLVAAPAWCEGTASPPATTTEQPAVSPAAAGTSAQSGAMPGAQPAMPLPPRPASDIVNHRVFVMAGPFVPVDGDFDGHLALTLEYSWRHATRYVAVDYARSTSSTVVASTPAGVEQQLYGAVAGMRIWRGKWYYGAGIGLAEVKRELDTPSGAIETTRAHFGWEVQAGAAFWKRFVGQFKYMDAGTAGSRGFAAFLGITY